MIEGQHYIGRFAPSPTGPLHFGSVVVALASWLDARHHNGRWLLRIEDIDPPREDPKAPDQIMRQLAALGLHWDGAPLFQSQRLDAYQAALEDLKTRSLAYPCTCSRRDLPPIYPGTCQSRRFETTLTPYAIRLHIPSTRINLADPIQGPQAWQLPTEIGDFIIKRRDGWFAYQLAVTVDDAFQQISHVVRGSDLLDSTPKQIVLAQLLHRPSVSYAHIPLMVDQHGLKLSKSTGAAATSMDAPTACIRQALKVLCQPLHPEVDDLETLLGAATAAWSMERVPKKRELAAPPDQY